MTGMANTVFPSDLVQAQREWHHTYAQLAAEPAHAAVLRRRLLWLSCRLFWHPYWRTGPGRSPAARVELRELARAAQNPRSERPG